MTTRCVCSPDWTTTCPACTPDEAAARVADYLSQRDGQRGLDKDEINTVHSDPARGPAVLFTEDLRALVALAQSLRGSDVSGS